MSLKVCALASGSKGNCTFVSDGETNILIDLGISALKAERFLKALNADPDNTQIFVTHSHSDHIGGVPMFVKHHNVAVHCQRECAPAVFAATGVRPTVDVRETQVGALTVRAIPVPHDVPCFGYVVKSGEASLAVVTDIGNMSVATLNSLCGCGLIMLEANHDVNMLRQNRKYTPQLKARILSANGHLSNSSCADACAYLAQNGVKNFILAHLSEENNLPSLAVGEVLTSLEMCGITDARVVAASQNSPTGLFEIC